MPVEITMPQLSDTMTEGTLVKWRKQEGQSVSANEEIADVETDKATMPMEAFEAGTMAYLAATEGEKVKVGALLAVIATGSENPAEIKAKYAGKSSGPTAAAAPAQAPATATDDAPGGAAGAHSHDVLHRGPIEQGHADARKASVQDDPEHTSEAISQEAAAVISGKRPGVSSSATGRIRVSPLARRLAEQRNIPLSQVAGTGPGGRITQQDVQTYLAGKSSAPAAAVEDRPVAAPASPKPPAQSVRPEPISAPRVREMSRMRQTIAKRLQMAKQTLPHFYETIDIDVEQLSALRERLNQQLKPEGIKLSLGDLIHKGVAAALMLHPALNATFDGERITEHPEVNLGIAVALESGLIVPVLRGIQRMGLRDIRQRSADLIDRARSQRLKQDELSGATFTVSNLGAYGVREFSAIINPPEVGILAVGAAGKRAVVDASGQIVARTIMSVTLSADHRVVDGATAGEFLRTLRGLLEEPGLLLL